MVRIDRGLTPARRPLLKTTCLMCSHNDVANVSRFLTERFQYKREDMVTLCDLPGASGPSLPTRANIVSGPLAAVELHRCCHMS